MIVDIDGVEYEAELTSVHIVEPCSYADNPDDYYGYSEVEFTVEIDGVDVYDDLTGTALIEIEEALLEAYNAD